MYVSATLWHPVRPRQHGQLPKVPRGVTRGSIVTTVTIDVRTNSRARVSATRSAPAGASEGTTTAMCLGKSITSLYLAVEREEG